MTLKLDFFLDETGSRKSEIRSQIEQHMTRAEAVKEHVNKLKTQGKYHEQRKIADDSTGNSYQSIFSPFLDNSIIWVRIEDAYLMSNQQV